MPRYTLELHWPDGKITTGDHDSRDAVYEVGDCFADAAAKISFRIERLKEAGATWRIERIEDAPEPFLAKLVCAPLLFEV